jgi:NAD(P)-dependent dehydrogenase (short-subunit alcohol dehydrogenase family)
MFYTSTEHYIKYCDKMLDQTQKTALITGSATRIGKYVAEMLASNGWKIALHYHNSEQEAYQLAKELINHTDVILFKADLTHEEQAINLFKEVTTKLGPISLLINNASIYKNDNISNLNTDRLDQHMNIHLKTPLYLSKLMEEQDISGNIINFLDTEIFNREKKFFSYRLSKKALFNLTQMLAVSLAPNIRVNAIALGPILFKEGQNLELFNQLIEDSPLKIKAELEDLYNTIIFLLNTKSITGQCIFLDGGMHL